MMTVREGQFSKVMYLFGAGRRADMGGRRWFIGLVAVAMVSAVAGFAQVQGSPDQGSKGHDLAQDSANKPADTAGSPNQPTDANLQRQKQLEDDTAKLLVLAHELKAEMDKSTKDTLSLSVIKKAEEIEKLARKVRSEMKPSTGN